MHLSIRRIGVSAFYVGVLLSTLGFGANASEVITKFITCPQANCAVEFTEAELGNDRDDEIVIHASCGTTEAPKPVKKLECSSPDVEVNCPVVAGSNKSQCNCDQDESSGGTNFHVKVKIEC
ncbi:MAG: hypothetical protein AAGF57_09540 [Pseudomonadota bacterium]